MKRLQQNLRQRILAAGLPAASAIAALGVVLAATLPMGPAGRTAAFAAETKASKSETKASNTKPTAEKAPTKATGNAVAAKTGAASSTAKPAAGKPATKAADSAAKEAEAEPVKLPETVYSTGYDGSFLPLIQFINERIRAAWQENNVAPSDPADDAEWLRRVHLDIVGHIPDLEAFEKFVADKDKAKRSKMIDSLLEDPGYVRNFTTIWTNNLIGRQSSNRVSRPGMQKFLREAFAKNRPWSQMVVDLLSAEGHMDENGATNFLMSHLNDGAVPATAISARLFLGIQVQCTQCHNHPFNDWKQEAFWEFNSFFKQARRREVRKYDEKRGRMVFDYSVLEPAPFQGPMYFENRAGLMKVAFPTYNGTKIDDGPDVNRRAELAKLVISGERPLVADAMVNRMWGHFFGYGFTKPVDDMGPHNAPSHPAILEKMSTEFVKAGYDMKQLIRWICNSEAYNLTSKFGTKNTHDNPAGGETQLFSHLYTKSMNAEQLYDSLIVATNAHKSGSSGWEQAERQRQTWLQQFVVAFGTDENDEATSFDGTIPQALMMMNGDLVATALGGAKGSLLNTVMAGKGSDNDKVKQLYAATLSRYPSAKEVTAAKKVLKNANRTEAFQDLYWALLNCNEFIFNH